MARRPIFIPYSEGARLVREVDVEFKWNPGFAPVQKKKNIVALHESAKIQGFEHLLEVSTKSEIKLGTRLSAFNMPVELDDGTSIALECAFQGSKVFEKGGPYRDIYRKSSREAKKDERIRESGKIIGFNFEGFEFPNEPKTAFYDWLYSRALAPHREYLESLCEYDGFTDIEFNPNKSINCQARSCALFVSLVRKGLLDHAIKLPNNFIETVASDSFAQPYSDDVRQGKLL
jgi:hypothetical protein